MDLFKNYEIPTDDFEKVEVIDIPSYFDSKRIQPHINMNFIKYLRKNGLNLYCLIDPYFRQIDGYDFYKVKKQFYKLLLQYKTEVEDGGKRVTIFGDMKEYKSFLDLGK